MVIVVVGVGRCCYCRGCWWIDDVEELRMEADMLCAGGTLDYAWRLPFIRISIRSHYYYCLDVERRAGEAMQARKLLEP